MSTSNFSLNVGNFITLRLSPNNYPLWREQALALAESQDMVGHLTNDDPAPTKYTNTTAENTTPQLTDAFITWRKTDRLLRGWIIGTLSEEALGIVVGLETAHAVWEALKDAYAQDSKEREFTLRQNLTYLRKEENTTITEHIRSFKALCDNLAAIGKPVPDKEKVFCLLTSLGPQYETFTTTMLKPPRPSYTDLISQLQNFDQRRNWFSTHTNISCSSLTHQLAFYGQQRSQANTSYYRGSPRKFTSSGRGFQAQQQRDSSSGTSQRRPPPPGERRMTPAEREKYREEKCQYCGMMGHVAKICWWIPKKPIQENEIPQALAALTLDTSLADTEWTTDTGASNHMTGKPGILSNIRKYSGTDSVIIGDGSSMPILAIGDSCVKQKSSVLPLNDVLLVPNLTKNLLSVSQLTKQYPVNCEFTNVDFYVKKRETGQAMIKGRRKGDLYVLPNSPELYFSHRFKSSTAEIWHQRLGHPQHSALEMLKNKGLIDVTSRINTQHLCDSCQLGKLSRLPFSRCEHSSTGSFEKIHCDLWGPSPVLSMGNFKYYACFVDDFSKYTWIVPMRNKSDFYDVYIAFEKYVLRQFNKQIKNFHSDGGGEFINTKLSTYFLSTGIVHQVSAPYTPEQTGMVERRHRTIRELGMTMLFQCGAPLFLWIEAFTTAVYLMNRLPSSALNFETPYFALHGSHPDYSLLRAFGSKCFPYTWDTRKHKFDPKTLPCIFVGYSEKHKAYKCYHPSSKKLFISRHVVFDELIFPYKQFNKSTRNQSHVNNIFDTWLPHTNNSSSAGVMSDSFTPYCQSPLPSVNIRRLDVLQGNDATEFESRNSRSPLISETNFSLESELEGGNDSPLRTVESIPSLESQTSYHLSPPSATSEIGSQTSGHSSPPSAPIIHPMVTRSRAGVIKPNPKYALSTGTSSTIPREPTNVKTALAHPGWKAAMVEELDALHKNETWTLVPRTPNMNVIGSKWVFKTKLKPDGSLERLKARLVAKGYHQIDGVDFTETFSPVVKPGTIRMVLTIAVVKKWSIRQLDVKNAFLHGLLNEDIYMQQPPGMADSQHPNYVCKLRKTIYGLRQASRAWFDRFSTFLIDYGFFCSLADPSLFIFHSNHGSLILLLYVDDMLVTGSNPTLISKFIKLLSGEFTIKDLGPIHHFLGMEIRTTPDGLHLSQSHYALTILERTNMVECKPMSTPLEAKTKQSSTDILIEDPSYYRGIVGALQYLTLTRLDLSFSVNYVSQYMHAPTVAHLKMVRRILRYVKGTINMG